jgi:serine protease Do
VRANDATIRSATQMRNVIGLTPVGRPLRMTIERDHALQLVTVRSFFSQTKG